MKLMLFLLILSLFYIVVSILSIRWILRHEIMNRFQKTVHTVLVLLLPVFWFYLIRMIFKPISGYRKRQGFNSGTNGEAGGFEYYSADDIGAGGGADGD